MKTYEDAFGELFSERLNIEALLLADADGDAYLNLRARPWKNSIRDGYMLLVGGYTFEDCLVLLAQAYESAHWLKLEWTRRIQPDRSPERPALSILTRTAQDELSDK